METALRGGIHGGQCRAVSGRRGPGLRRRISPAFLPFVILLFFVLPSPCFPDGAGFPGLLGHEERHSTQYALCCGIPFLPLYFAAAGWSLWRAGNPGTANPFERHAGLAAGGYPEHVDARPRGWRRSPDLRDEPNNRGLSGRDGGK